MRHLTLLIALSLLCGAACHGADAAAAAPSVVQVPGRGALELTLPPGWKLSARETPPGIPPTIKVGNADRSLSLLITVFPPMDPAKDQDTQEKIDAMVRLTSGQYVDGSVEKVITIKKLATAHGLGSYASFTDADLVNVQQPAPGQFKTVTNGELHVGDLTMVFTLLAGSLDGTDFKAALGMIAGVKKSGQ